MEICYSPLPTQKGTPVPLEEGAAQAWLAQQGFQVTDLHSEILIVKKAKFPMAWACQKGEINVCQWLYENGAAEDITRATSTASATPMILAWQEGHLAVCRWLFDMGAAADITTMDKEGESPMWIACYQGRLPVCEWLYEMGASEDICKRNNYGVTPMYVASQNGH